MAITTRGFVGRRRSDRGDRPAHDQYGEGDEWPTPYVEPQDEPVLGVVRFHAGYTRASGADRTFRSDDASSPGKTRSDRCHRTAPSLRTQDRKPSSPASSRRTPCGPSHPAPS